MSKMRIPPSAWTISTIRIGWDSHGSVTCRKRDHNDARSTLAASYSSLGIVWSPARSTRAENGSVFHTLAVMMAR